MARAGGTALKPEQIAAAMGVSRGSFYWHFRNVGEYHREVLQAAERIVVDEPFALADQHGGPDRRATLGWLIGRAFSLPQTLDRAIFSWASFSALAADAARRIGKRRVELLAAEFRRIGLDAEDASTRAMAIYWTHLGRCMSPEQELNSDAAAELVAIFLARNAK